MSHSKQINKSTQLTKEMILHQKKKLKSDKRVIKTARFLYNDLIKLSNKKGYCYATNKYLSEEFGVHPDTISHWLTSLERANYIERKEVHDQRTRQVIERRIYIVKPNDMNEEVSTDTTSEKCPRGVGDSVEDNLLNKSFKSLKQEEEEKEDTEANELFSVFKNLNQTITDNEKHVLRLFKKEFGKDFVLYAINKSIHATHKIAYIRTLLNDWKQRGIKAISELETKFNVFGNKTKKAQNTSNKNNKNKRNARPVIRKEIVPDWLEAATKSWEDVNAQTQSTTDVPSVSSVSSAPSLNETTIRAIISSFVNFNIPVVECYKSVVDQYINDNPSVLTDVKMC